MPIAKPYAAFAQDYLDDEMIKRFQGDGAVVSIGIVDKYVLGIADDCMPEVAD